VPGGGDAGKNQRRSSLGYRPFPPVTGVRIPVGAPSRRGSWPRPLGVLFERARCLTARVVTDVCCVCSVVYVRLLSSGEGRASRISAVLAPQKSVVHMQANAAGAHQQNLPCSETSRENSLRVCFKSLFIGAPISRGRGVFSNYILRSTMESVSRCTSWKKEAVA
jgi:hypothetical protein